MPSISAFPPHLPRKMSLPRIASVRSARRLRLSHFELRASPCIKAATWIVLLEIPAGSPAGRAVRYRPPRAHGRPGRRVRRAPSYPFPTVTRARPGSAAGHHRLIAVRLPAGRGPPWTARPALVPYVADPDCSGAVAPACPVGPGRSNFASIHAVRRLPTRPRWTCEPGRRRGPGSTDGTSVSSGHVRPAPMFHRCRCGLPPRPAPAGLSGAAGRLGPAEMWLVTRSGGLDHVEASGMPSP